jgi:hypothetical protein
MSNDAPQLKFTTKRTHAEVWRVYLANGFRRPTFILGYLFILIAAPWLYVFGSEVSKGYAEVGIGFLFLLPVFYAIAMWRAIAANPSYEAPTSISLFEWGFRAENHLEESSLTWENFDSFSETRNHILLRARGKRLTTIFPKRDLTSSQLSLFLTILSAHLKGTRRFHPNDDAQQIVGREPR